jgi:hypothetical protein
MKTYTSQTSLVLLKIKRENTVELLEEKKTELIELQARISELEKELALQLKEEKKQSESWHSILTYNFNNDFLF